MRCRQHGSPLSLAGLNTHREKERRSRHWHRGRECTTHVRPLPLLFSSRSSSSFCLSLPPPLSLPLSPSLSLHANPPSLSLSLSLSSLASSFAHPHTARLDHLPHPPHSRFAPPSPHPLPTEAEDIFNIWDDVLISARSHDTHVVMVCRRLRRDFKGPLPKHRLTQALLPQPLSPQPQDALACLVRYSAKDPAASSAGMAIARQALNDRSRAVHSALGSSSHLTLKVRPAAAVVSRDALALQGARSYHTRARPTHAPPPSPSSGGVAAAHCHC